MLLLFAAAAKQSFSDWAGLQVARRELPVLG